MGGGRTGLFVGTKGADPQQLTLMPEPISVRHRGPNYVVGQSVSVGGIAQNITIKSRVLLLTPRDVLIKCMHWRIKAVSEGELLQWIQERLNNKRYIMMPTQLRPTLIKYLPKLKATMSIGKGYNIKKFSALIVELEETLEAMSQ